jgi:hypothetical protein
MFLSSGCGCPNAGATAVSIFYTIACENMGQLIQPIGDD